MIKKFYSKSSDNLNGGNKFTEETPSITFTEDKYKKFKNIFEESEKDGKSSFYFENKEILVTYARYVLEYLSQTYE